MIILQLNTEFSLDMVKLEQEEVGFTLRWLNKDPFHFLLNPKRYTIPRTWNIKKFPF